MLLGGGVDRAPLRAALDTSDALVGINVDAVHGAQIDADAGVDQRGAGDAMAAAVDGEGDVLLAGDVDGGGDVVGARGPGDHGRAPVDHPVEQGPRLVVGGIGRAQQLPSETG